MAAIETLKHRAAWITVILALAIGYSSLVPLDRPPLVPGSDKLHHFIAYAALCFPLLLRDARLARFVLPAAIAYGGAIELLQPFVNRHSELADFGANALGCLFAYGVARLAEKWLA